MERKKHILVFIDWYLPGYKAGGPIRSVAALVAALRDEFTFSIVTSDRDFGDTRPYPGVALDEWTTAPDGTRTRYCRQPGPNAALLRHLITTERPDVIYINSFFSYRFSILPLRIARQGQLSPTAILAPRGMLGPGALQIKRLKKQLYIRWAKLIGRYRHLQWHATSDEEAREIRAIFGDACTVHIAGNLPSTELPGFRWRPKQAGQVNLFYLSRISPKKNLLGALTKLRCVSHEYRAHFAIMGPAEDDRYLEQCHTAARMLPHNVTIAWIGAVDHSSLFLALKDQHFLLLPTLHENFGHVFLESWSASCPVITSDQTPWHDLEARQIGWEIALSDEHRWTDVLNGVAKMGPTEYQRWSEASYRFAASYAASPAVLDACRRLFR